MNFTEELKSLKDQVSFDGRFEPPSDFNNMVIAGMGGSGIAGKIFSEMYDDVPVLSLDDYHVPGYVNDKTVFIAMSYSGNTEEVITSTDEALKRGAHVYAVSSGGKLSEMIKDTLEIPSGLQPRSSLGYMLMPLINTFLQYDDDSVERTISLLDRLDTDNEMQKTMASEIIDGERIPVIYGLSPYRAVAYRWRTQFHENSKILAFSHYFPELDHNEIIPLKSTYRKDLFKFYVLTGGREERNDRRVRVTEDVTGAELRKIEPLGDTLLEKIFYLIHFGDYLTFHLAKLRGVDATDVSTIEELKKKL